MAKSNLLTFLMSAALCAANILPASAAIPVRWSVDTFRVKPLGYTCYHGETLDLVAEMSAYGEPLNLAGKTARLYWQTNGMDQTYWSTNASVASAASVTNILSATFSGAFDPGASSVSGFIGVEGENYRASFTLTFLPSPGFTPSRIAPPVKFIDFATTAVANPEASPFVVKGGSGGVDAMTATGIARAVVAPFASTQTVHTATLASHASQLSQMSQTKVGGLTATNITDGILLSSNLCNAGALQAMTNAMEAVGTRHQIVRGEYVDYYGGYWANVNVGWAYSSEILSGSENSLNLIHPQFSDRPAFTEGYKDAVGVALLPDIESATNVAVVAATNSAKAYADATFATSNMVVAVVDDRADRAVTTAVDNAMKDLLGDDWKTTYGGGLAGLIAAIVAALTWLKTNRVGKITCTGVQDITASSGTANVSSLFTSANTSLVSSTRYALAASDASSGSTLSDRTINRVNMTTSAQTFAMPNRDADKARDFIVRVEVGDLETIGGIAFSGVTAWEGDALTFEKNKNYIVAITETKYANNAPTWLIKVLAVDTQTQG